MKQLGGLQVTRSEFLCHFVPAGTWLLGVQPEAGWLDMFVSATRWGPTVSWGVNLVLCIMVLANEECIGFCLQPLRVQHDFWDRRECHHPGPTGQMWCPRSTIGCAPVLVRVAWQHPARPSCG